MTHFPLKKIVAAILPICFLWFFAACVLFCGNEGAEIHQHYSALSETAADVSDSDSCPILNAPAVIVSERTVFDCQISSVVRHLTFPVEISSFTAARISRRDGEPPFREPPLKRLPVLRI